MAEIEWESETVNPWCGCDVIEPEGHDCYAERFLRAGRADDQDRVD